MRNIFLLNPRAIGGLLLASMALFSATATAQVQRSFVNLGFERQPITPADQDCLELVSSSAVPGWITSTTRNDSGGTCGVPAVPGPPGVIEIWRNKAVGSNNFGARSGVQRAELNAHEASRLSQTVCLTQGERVGWKLSHHALNAPDVRDEMAFDIDEASTIAALSSANNAANTISTGTATCTSTSGSLTDNACVWTAGPRGWSDYNGSFTWNGPTGLHSFGFKAISSITPNVGNHLDDIDVFLRPYVEFVGTSATTVEGTAAVLPKIRVLGTVATTPMTITFSPIGGTATAGNDYPAGTSLTLTIPVGTYTGDSASLFTVPTFPSTDNSLIQENRTVVLGITSNPNAYTVASTTTCGGEPQATATVNISDNDVDLKVAKTVTGSTTPLAGTGTTQFTVVYSNNTAKPTVGDTTAHDVVASVSDAVPPGLTFSSWTCTGSGGGVCPAPSGSGAISGNATLPAGASGAAGGNVTYVINATVGPVCTAITNSASIAANAPHSEATDVQAPFASPTAGGVADNTATAGVTPQCMDLSITKTDNSATYTPGTTATYVLHACNAGPGAGTGVSINDTLPNGLTLSAPWTCTGTDGGTCPASGGAVGESAVIVAGVNLPKDACVDVSVPVNVSNSPASF